MARVLIVDDDWELRELLAQALEDEGYDVLTLPDGSRVREVLAEQSEPCVTLLDLTMPCVSGWSVCHALEAEPALMARHPLIVMTAEHLPNGAVLAPAHALLRKPFDLNTLYQLVAQAVSGAFANAGAQANGPMIRR